jgi:hypothetical protein
MKKILFILALSLLFITCKSKKNITTAKPANYITYTDKFKTSTDAQTKAFLKKLNAEGEDYSVLLLTRKFVGSELTVTAGGKEIYKGYALTDKSNGLAETLRIPNTTDTRIYDTYTKQEVLLEAGDLKKHKFVYVAKTGRTQTPFGVAYSHKLRAMK